MRTLSARAPAGAARKHTAARGQRREGRVGAHTVRSARCNWMYFSRMPLSAAPLNSLSEMSALSTIMSRSRVSLK